MENISDEADSKRDVSFSVPWTRQPRAVLYTCSSCGGFYNSVVTSNPWWSLAISRCNICQSIQIPRLDIEHPLNSLELDTLFMSAFGERDRKDDIVDIAKPKQQNEVNLHDNPEEIQTVIEDDIRQSVDTSNSTTVSTLSYVSEEKEVIESIHQVAESIAIDQREDEVNYRFEQYISKEDAVKLVILMTHARLCLGQHVSEAQREICTSIKYLMLHLRDCYDEVCVVPWCKGGKLVLHHLRHCFCPSNCVICTVTPDVPTEFQRMNNQNMTILHNHSRRWR